MIKWLSVENSGFGEAETLQPAKTLQHADRALESPSLHRLLVLILVSSSPLLHKYTFSQVDLWDYNIGWIEVSLIQLLLTSTNNFHPTQVIVRYPVRLK